MLRVLISPLAMLLAALSLAVALLATAAAPAEASYNWSPEKLARWHSLHEKQHANQWPLWVERKAAKESR